MEKKELKKLQQLSKEEKIEVAQLLWDDIARNQNQLDIPEGASFTADCQMKFGSNWKNPAKSLSLIKRSIYESGTH